MSYSIKIGFAGFGIWGRGMAGREAFESARAEDFQALRAHEFSSPKPEAIPARERRRAGLMINLAVEVAHQACEHAGADKSLVPSVFVSAMGDTAITDYMCRKLAQPEKLLSPTKFHNSVHNAPSGYWTISAENRAPSSFVGGFRESFGAGLLEAASQAHAYDHPVLLVAYDIANAAPFEDIEPVGESLGVALVVTNVADHPAIATADATFGDYDSEPSLPQSQALRTLAQANPIGASLALVERLANIESGTHTNADLAQTLHFSAAPKVQLRLGF